MVLLYERFRDLEGSLFLLLNRVGEVVAMIRGFGSYFCLNWLLLLILCISEVDGPWIQGDRGLVQAYLLFCLGDEGQCSGRRTGSSKP